MSVEVRLSHFEIGGAPAVRSPILPYATVRALAKMLLYKYPKERNRVLDALRKAGLPE